MKVSRYFVWVDSTVDTSASATGWRLRDMPTFDPVSSFRIHVMTHDIMEHFPNENTELKHEMMAFGASYFIRVFGKWKNFKENPFNSGGQNTQYNDITSFLHERDWKIESTDEKIHPDLIHCLNYCIRKHNSHVFIWGDEDAKKRAQAQSEVIKMCFRWISIGYVRTMERWNGVPNWKICRMFERMTDTIKKITDASSPAHGDTMVVTFDTETLKFTVDHNMKYRNYTFGRICIKKTINGILEFIENNRSPINA